VWGWASWFDLGQLAYKLFGYGNKADDADEVGYTIFNYLLNGLARGAAQGVDGSRIPIIALGHSFGGRLVSRALFSDHLLKSAYRTDAPQVDLFIGLQAAFSINRFIRRCPDHDREKHCGNEGSPYESYVTRKTTVILTTSEHDTANPLAWFLTRARHAGGGRGLKRAREHELTPNRPDGVFHILSDAKPTVLAERCGELQRRPPTVIVVDAKPFVFDHNDVLDLETGELIWGAMRCFTSAAS
jgi:hypothetical protein